MSNVATIAIRPNTPNAIDSGLIARSVFATSIDEMVSLSWTPGGTA